MRRKLIPQGVGGHTIYLPKKWVNQRGLKARDEVFLEEKEANLVISTKSSSEKTAILNFEVANKKLIRTIISSYYRQGYTLLTLKFNDPASLVLIQDIISTLRGYELTEQKNRECVIEDIAMLKKEDVNKEIIKYFQLINFLFEALFISNTSKKDLFYLRKETLKARDYVQRIIVLQKEDRSYEHYAFILGLEKIASKYYRISCFKKINKEDINLLKEIHTLFMELYSLFLKNDCKKSMRFHERMLRLRFCLEEKNHKTVSLPVLLNCYDIYQILFTLSSRLQAIHVDAKHQQF